MNEFHFSPGDAGVLSRTASSDCYKLQFHFYSLEYRSTLEKIQLTYNKEDPLSLEMEYHQYQFHCEKQRPVVVDRVLVPGGDSLEHKTGTGTARPVTIRAGAWQ